MLYYLFPHRENISLTAGGRLFQYITFRALLALIISLVISMLFGGRVIGLLKKLQIGETVRDLGLSGQKKKKALLLWVVSLSLWQSWYQPYCWRGWIMCIFYWCCLPHYGWAWLDSLTIISKYFKDKAGLKAIFKISGQFVLGLVIAIVMLYHDDVLVRMRNQKHWDIIIRSNKPFLLRIG